MVCLSLITISASCAADSDGGILSDSNNTEVVGTANYYFNANAERDGDGSHSHPYKYLKEDRVKDNSIIHLAKGHYSYSPSKTHSNVAFYGEDSSNTFISGNSHSLSLKGNVYLKSITFTNVPIVNNGHLDAHGVVFSKSTGSNGDYEGKFGGAIYSTTNGNYVSLNNCTFINNHADYGGAIYFNRGVLEINNCFFTDNIAYHYGGSIACLGERSSRPTFTLNNSTFLRDSSTKNAGGAIYLKLSKFTANNLNIISCSAVMGGGVAVLNSTVSVDNCYGFNNFAEYDGGVFYQFLGQMTLKNSNFDKNIAINGGALFIDTLHSANIVNNFFENNEAELHGGAIYSIFNKFTINGNTFLNNFAMFYNNIYQQSTPSLVIASEDYLMYKNKANINSIPHSYNSASHGYVTSVKDQLSSNNCWAFAAIATLESCILRASGQSLDLSEENLKNLASIYSRYGWLKDTNYGGFDDMAIGYLTSWLGPVMESDDPSHEIGELSPLLESVMHVQNILFLKRNSYTDNNNIKKAIMNFGAVAASVYMDEHWDSHLQSYVQCYQGSSNPNHAIVVVGWDDNVVISNKKGAWIVKNSWGSDWSKNGYYYVSYYDKSCFKVGHDASGYTFILNDTIKFNKNYQYDIARTNYLHSSQKTAWYKNIFTATDDETLAAVSTYFEKNTNWELSIYVNNVLVQTKSGFSTPGYYTINLNKYVPLKTGDVFEVVFKITANSNIGVPISEIYELNNYFYHKHVSYISYDGIKWEDLYSYYKEYGDDFYDSQVACIKAFTFEHPIHTSTALVISYNGYNPVEITAHVVDQFEYLLHTGYVLFNLSGKEYKVNVENGMAKITHIFERGDNQISATFIDKNHYSSTDSTVINVKKIDVEMNRVNSVYNLDTALFTISISQPITETVYVYVNGKTYTFKIKNGYGELLLTELDYGLNNYRIHLYDAIYVASDISGNFTVNVKRTKFTLSPLKTTYKSGVTYTINFGDVYGELLHNKPVQIIFDGKTYDLTTNNGKVSLVFTMPVGIYDLTARFKGDDVYLPVTSKTKINVVSSVVLASTVYTTNSKLKIQLLNRDLMPVLNSQFTMIFNGRTYNLKTDSFGYAYYDIKLNPKSYSLRVSNPKTGEKANIKIKVVPKITKNKNLKIYYGSDKLYKIRVCNDYGKYEAGIKVTIYLNKKKYHLNTNNKGYVSLKFNLLPKTYKITAISNGFKVSNKVVIKPTILTKDIKVKKGKTIKFKAILLNKKGKILKNKKVTFKFNGKSYKVSTNKKGVSTLKLKNNYLSGKYPIISSYGKLNIKNTIKIL